MALWEPDVTACIVHSFDLNGCDVALSHKPAEVSEEDMDCGDSEDFGLCVKLLQCVKLLMDQKRITMTWCEQAIFPQEMQTPSSVILTHVQT